MRTSRVITSTLLVVGLVGFAALLDFGAQAQQGYPAAKAAVAIDEVINLTAGVSGGAAGTAETGWVDILTTQIKTSSQKDLVFDVALQCGILTDTTVKSSGGSLSSAGARARIAVKVLVDGQPAEPDNSEDINGEFSGGVVYCDRFQQLEARFAGLNCTADPVTGVVSCTDPETLRLILRSMNANAFNFAKADVGVGVHTIKVQAKAMASIEMNNSINLAGAEAFAGAGSLLVEEVRLVKDVQIVF